MPPVSIYPGPCTYIQYEQTQFYVPAWYKYCTVLSSIHTITLDVAAITNLKPVLAEYLVQALRVLVLRTFIP